MKVLAYGHDALTQARLNTATLGAGGEFVHAADTAELRKALSSTNIPELAIVDREANGWNEAAALLRTKPRCRVVLVVESAAKMRDSGPCVERPLTREIIAMLLRANKVSRNPPQNFRERIAERYELLEPLGEGHGGRVFRARDQHNEHPVLALKLLPLPQTEPAATRLRYRCRREAASLAATDHPVIINLYDSGEWDNNFYLAAEFIEGITLERWVQENGPLSTEMLLKVAEDLASAIVHLENLGIVHRDVKPGNVMLAEDGRIRLVDFGLARTCEEQSHATASGDLRGTPHVIAPESIAGDGDPDSQADVYALGCTLFFLSTGGYPFTGRSVMEILSAHVYKDPENLAEAGPVRPHLLSELVWDMLRKDPEMRPRPRQAMARAISARYAFECSGEGDET